MQWTGKKTDLNDGKNDRVYDGKKDGDGIDNAFPGENETHDSENEKDDCANDEQNLGYLANDEGNYDDACVLVCPRKIEA